MILTTAASTALTLLLAINICTIRHAASFSIRSNVPFLLVNDGHDTRIKGRRAPPPPARLNMCPFKKEGEKEDDDDPTKAWYAGVADGIQNLLTNSPLNEGKKALVRSLAGDYDREAVRARLNALIEENSVLMLSFVTWPFCVKAKAVLDSSRYSASYEVVELDEDADGKAIRAEMADLIGRTSVPAIWIGGEFIGGCNDGPRGGIVRLDESGELRSILEAAGAI